MDRLTLAMLEVTNGKLPAATLTFQKGLNVVSGAENRGKSYAFGCLDYIFGASEPPDPNPHSADYTGVSLYYTVNATQRGVVWRSLKDGEAQYLPLHSASGDVPSSGWQELAKTHRAKSTSLSSYWVSAFGFPQSVLRGNMSGRLNALTIRTLAHLILIDELRIMSKATPARQTQATSWPADTDALALVLGARKTPPRGPAPVEPIVPAMSAEVREYIEQEVQRLDAQIQALSSATDKEADENNEMARRAAEFTAAADSAAKELRQILSDMEEAQRNLSEARVKTNTSREITTRLVLLQEYYASDLRRLEAIAEATFLLKQLNSVPCPTCEQPLAFEASAGDDEISTEYLEQIQVGAKAEAGKIRSLRRDLDETLARTRDDTEESVGTERSWSQRLESLREAERSQNKQVEKVHAQLNQTFAAIGQLAQRQALKQRRAELATQLVQAQPVPNEPSPATPTEDRTEFDSEVVDDFCETIEGLLTAWKWKYSEGPIKVTFDATVADILISGSARRSFGKAARALASSAFLIAIMDHCYAKGLPHPGFVVLDSPLTTKKDRNSTENDDEQASDEIVTAFFTHLAENYSDRQIIVFDNKEPPASLKDKITHYRFDDDASATRKGFFP
jgi:uncharacterized coiled-coil DUF342 family protein